MNTPDTEWKDELDTLLTDSELPIKELEYRTLRGNLETLISSLRTSRDTYWKERVGAEIADAVDLTKREIKHRVERYFKDAYLALKQQGGVHIHLEEIQEIIDDSTPPGFAPTPLQDK